MVNGFSFICMAVHWSLIPILPLFFFFSFLNLSYMTLYNVCMYMEREKFSLKVERFTFLQSFTPFNFFFLSERRSWKQH